MLVSLAHAAVTAAALKEGKQLSKERMKGELEVGAEIVKAVFSCAFLLSQAARRTHESCLAGSFLLTMSLFLFSSKREFTSSRSRASSRLVRPLLHCLCDAR